MELHERVAVLEERSRPKRKTISDKVKEWGGVGTLILALLYTFPLGVWDRFYLTAKARELAEVEELREVALEIAKLDGEWARTAGSIPTPEFQTMAVRSLGVQKVALLTNKLETLDRHQDQLTSSELVILAYSISQLNMPEMADDLYQAAYEKADKDKNIGLSADILRLRAQALLNELDGLDLAKMRGLYGRSIAQLSPLKNDAFSLQTAFNLFEWAQIELAKGDWKCGEMLAGMAQKKLADLPPLSPLIGQYQRQFEMAAQLFSQHPSQPNNGCPTEVKEYLK